MFQPKHCKIPYTIPTEKHKKTCVVLAIDCCKKTSSVKIHLQNAVKKHRDVLPKNLSDKN